MGNQTTEVLEVAGTEVGLGVLVAGGGVGEEDGGALSVDARAEDFSLAARELFDGMYAYFREHPTATHDHLMAFYQTRGCDDARGVDSASDGDLDIAFALLLADRQWGSCGPVNYAAAAQAVLADVADGVGVGVRRG